MMDWPCIQIEKEDIVYQIGNKKKLKDDFKVEMYPPFLTLVPNCGSTSKDPPYEMCLYKELHLRTVSVFIVIFLQKVSF